jgi:hypothetical protein
MHVFWTTCFLSLSLPPVMMSKTARSSSLGLQLSPRFMSMLTSSDLVRTHTVASAFARVAHNQASQAEPQLEVLDDWGGESLPHARMGADNLDLRSIIEVWFQVLRGCMHGGLVPLIDVPFAGSGPRAASAQQPGGKGDARHGTHASVRLRVQVRALAATRPTLPHTPGHPPPRTLHPHRQAHHNAPPPRPPHRSSNPPTSKPLGGMCARRGAAWGGGGGG